MKHLGTFHEKIEAGGMHCEHVGQVSNKAKFTITIGLVSVILTSFIYIVEYETPLHTRIIPKSIYIWDLLGKTKKQHVMFLKTHKTASSTIQNILVRFGLKHNLKFALGKKTIHTSIHQLGWPLEYQANLSYPTQGHEPYDLLCHHTRFSQDIKTVMAKDAIFITILREAVSAFESWFYYYEINKKLKMKNTENPLKIYAQDSELYPTFPEHEHGKNMYFSVRNPQIFDLGLDAMDDEKEIWKKISEIDQTFDLVLIAEYFDESLILLKDLLGWNIDDMVYFKQNVRPNSNKNQIDKKTYTRLRQLNMADTFLYEHFNKTFWGKAEKYGHEKLRQEVQELRALRKRWQDFCIVKTIQASEMNSSNSSLRPYKPYTLGYTLSPQGENNETCQLLAMPELPLNEKILKHSFENNLLQNMS